MFDVASFDQRSHHAVRVDATDRRDLAPTYRLLVCDDRQRLKCGTAEPSVAPLQDILFDHADQVRMGLIAVPASDRRYDKTPRNLFVLGAQSVDDVRCFGFGHADQIRQ